MWVKICGNTNLEDCLLAAELGAQAVGFVFAPGKRTVSADQVAGISAELPRSIDKIGVFTTSDFATIVSTVKRAGLTGVQLHGELDAHLITRLRKRFSETMAGCRLFQVVPWFLDEAASEEAKAFAAKAHAAAKVEAVDALLVDSRSREQSGGTGRTFDWKAAKPVIATVKRQVIVAGGLTPDNVAEAIHTFEPWGVDVVSGVEASPGKKDPEKLAAFLREAHLPNALEG